MPLSGLKFSINRSQKVCVLVPEPLGTSGRGKPGFMPMVSHLVGTCIEAAAVSAQYLWSKQGTTWRVSGLTSLGQVGEMG